jgi:hypothetical protein
MAGKINVPITTAIQGIANVQRQLSSLSKGITSIGRTAGVAAIGFATFAAGVKGADFAVQAIAGARDLERNILGLKTVFEEVTPQMRLFTRNAEEVGLSLNEASKSSVFIGSVLKQSGFSIEETADLTERLVRLGTDLSLTYGYDVQEALLGMTALFRGEYDPIEKFGVAMKQSEINSELAARGLDNLEGAARRFAEQQIRVELLFQRSADAQGAFERGAGTLAVEQLRLQATFNNLRDTVAMGLLPIMGELTQSFREGLEIAEPEIIKAFDALEPVLVNLNTTLVPVLIDFGIQVVEIFTQIIDLVGKILDPTTRVGESVAALFIQIESLFTTITGNQVTIEDVFGAIAEVIRFVADTIQSVIYLVENLIISFQVAGEQIALILKGDWAGLLSKNWREYRDGLVRAKDAANEQKLATMQLNQELANQEFYLKKGMQAWSNSWIARGEWAKAQGLVPKAEDIVPPASDFSTEGGKAAKNYVDEFIKKLKEDVQKQTAREQLGLKGASEGLIDAILGSEGWMKIWQQIKSGKIALKDLQDQFYATAAGAKELKDAADKAAKELEEYNEKVAKINERLAEELAAIAEKAAEAKAGFKDLLDAFSILPTIEREVGKFESQVTGYLDSILQSLKTAFDNKDILESGYKELQAFARKELALLAEIGRQRDELAQRFDLADGLIRQYRDAFTAAASLTQLFGQLKDETETRTVTSVTRGLVRLGSSMREFEVTVTNTYEETIGKVVSKSQGLLDGFRTLAEKARAFGDNLRKLRELGLDPMLFNQLVEAGVEAGGETAKALVEGGQDTINELNGLFKEIDTIGGTLGEEVAVSLYGTGIDLANGLLEGIRSKQQELENQARTMAEAFNRAFQAALNIQIDLAAAFASDQARARAAADIAALGPAPVVPPKINEAGLAQLDMLIRNANRYAGNIQNQAKQLGALQKLEIYETLRDAVKAGAAIDLTGIQSGLSTQELTNRATAAGVNVSNYYVNVSSDSRTGGAKAGEAIVESLQKFGQTNGNFTVGVAV